mgnify:CR=1 FL=1
MTRALLAGGVAAASILLFAAPALAQGTYPDRPVRFTV